MALVTVQRSPSPSTEHEGDSISEDTTDGKSILKKSLSESYFAYKGAALILPHTERTRKSSKKSHGGEIQDHLQAMLLLLRPEDQIKIAVRLEDVPKSTYKRYICVVATRGRQDTEEAVILGMDCARGEAVIGLVVPVWLSVTIQLEGDGSFRLCTDQQAYLFNPVSVQAMWSAIQSFVKVLHQAEEMKYIHDGLTHTWVEYYRSRIDHGHVSRDHHWTIDGVQVFAPSILNVEDESVKMKISNVLKDVMLSVDLDEVTCVALRLAVEKSLGFSVKEHKAFFDEEMIRIFGQMDAPSKILDYLYLGSEWNASNFDELMNIGVGYILNISKEIDNFFLGTFQYYTVRLPDVEESDLLRHWDKTFKFISKARSHGSKVLVHCKMGISRSASTVMAYLMKENRWSVDEAFAFVKERRSVVNPNKGFMGQLRMYENILSASNKREYFRTKTSDNQSSPTDEGMLEGMVQDQGCMLGDNLINVMATDWMTMVPSTAANMEKLQYGSSLLLDLEGTESRSGDSMEESLPDMPSPPSLPCEKIRITDSDLKSGDGVQGDVNQTNNVNLSVSPGPFKIKPDSFWIKQEEEDANGAENDLSLDISFIEMKESSVDKQCTARDQPLQPTEICNVEHKLNLSCLSENDSDSIVKDQNSLLFPSNPHTISSLPTTGASEFPTTQIPPHGFHSISSQSTKNASPPLSIEQIDISRKDGTRQMSACMVSHQDNTGKSEKKQPSELDVIPKDGDQSNFCDTLNSMQTSKQPGTSASVEVGIRDYFFREKIPWYPGKVQKIREGIDREGFIGDLGDDKEMMEVVSSPMDNMMMGEESFKMDIDKEKIILDECMEVSCPVEFSDPSKNEDKDTSPESSSALSLYEKEEIPVEPGTVLRTRMEIEERQKILRSSTGEEDLQATTDPSKPVLRTSSLKMTKEGEMAGLAPRRESCGPIMEPIRPFKKIDDEDNDLMMEENDFEGMAYEDGLQDKTNHQGMSEDVHQIPVVKNKPDSKNSDFLVEFSPSLNSETSTDSGGEVQVDSGIVNVKSFVRQIEKHPAEKIVLINDRQGNEDYAENMHDTCTDLQIKPSDPLCQASNRDAKLDLGFISGESNTDNPSLDATQCQCQGSSEPLESSVVRHLVGQFETKSPLESTKVITDNAETRSDQRLLDSEISSPVNFQTKQEAPGETEPAADNVIFISVSSTFPENVCLQQPSGGQHAASIPPTTSSSLSETNITTAGASSTLPSFLKLDVDDPYTREEREKEVWKPYQQISPQSTVENISSLRKKFESNSSQEKDKKETSSDAEMKNLPRPKSVERMCGVFEDKFNSDTSLVDTRKEDVETALRQVSEEGRKVRRLHGKSHPLTKLSRDMFHSSM